MEKKAFRKFKRLELVELLYQLRKENLELQRENKSLKKQLRITEKLAENQSNYTVEDLALRLDALLEEMRREREQPQQSVQE